MSDGEFDWGGRLRKGIGGAQRFPQNGWKPFEECKGRRELAISAIIGIVILKIITAFLSELLSLTISLTSGGI